MPPEFSVGGAKAKFWRDAGRLLAWFIYLPRQLTLQKIACIYRYRWVSDRLTFLALDVTWWIPLCKFLERKAYQWRRGSWWKPCSGAGTMIPISSHICPHPKLMTGSKFPPIFAANSTCLNNFPANFWERNIQKWLFPAMKFKDWLCKCTYSSMQSTSWPCCTFGNLIDKGA